MAGATVPTAKASATAATNAFMFICASPLARAGAASTAAQRQGVPSRPGCPLARARQRLWFRLLGFAFSSLRRGRGRVAAALLALLAALMPLLGLRRLFALRCRKLRGSARGERDG